MVGFSQHQEVFLSRFHTTLGGDVFKDGFPQRQMFLRSGSQNIRFSLSLFPTSEPESHTSDQHISICRVYRLARNILRTFPEDIGLVLPGGECSVERSSLHAPEGRWSILLPFVQLFLQHTKRVACHSGYSYGASTGFTEVKRGQEETSNTYLGNLYNIVTSERRPTKFWEFFMIL